MAFLPAPRSPLIPRAPSSTVSVSTESATGVSGSSLTSSLHAASLRDSESVSQHQGTSVVPDQGDGGTKMKMKAKAGAGAGAEAKTQAEGETIGTRREGPVQTLPSPSSGDGAVGGTSGDLHGVEALVESLAIASSSSTSASPSTPAQEPTPPPPPAHPFAHTTAKLELLPSSSSRTVHGIDVEEEARLYAAFDADDAYGYGEDGYGGDDGAYEEATDDFTRTNTPTGPARTGVGPGRRRTTSGPAKLTKSRSGSDSRSGSYPAVPPLTFASSSSSTSHLRSRTTPSSSSPSFRPPHSAPVPYTTYQPNRTRPPPESIFSADIYLADNTGSSTSTSTSAPPLFAQDVRIDGWVVVGDGAAAREEGGVLSPSASTPTPPSAGPSSAGPGFESGSTASARKAPTNDGHKSDSGLRLGSLLGRSKVGSLRKVSTGAGAYVVYDIAIVTKEGTTMRVLRRYSDFERLWVGLRGCLGRTALPHLPTLPPKAPLARFRPAFLENRRKHLEFWLTRVLLHPEIGGREVVRGWVLGSG